MANLLVLNGPNLNLLGVREPALYGHWTLGDVESSLRQHPLLRTHKLKFHQSNAEHVLVELIHQASAEGCDFVIINPGAFTHTSISLRDALLGTKLPFIELHISNVFAREPFRHKSYLSDIAQGVICGLGTFGYEAALAAAIHFIEQLDRQDGH